MRTDEAETLIRTVLHEVAPDADLTTLGPDDDLRDTLELDSLDFLQVVELLSDRSGARIDEEDYGHLARLADAAAWLSTVAAPAAAGPDR
jgi:acyl carrier protein